MKKLILAIALLLLTFVAVPAEPTFTVSGHTWLGFNIPIGGVTIFAGSTDCGTWPGVTIVNGPLVSDFSFEVPQACHNLQVGASKHGYVFTPDSYAIFFPTTQTNPITHIEFQVN